MLPNLAAVMAQQATEQTADNLSVSNAVGALRAIGDADWPDIVGRASTLILTPRRVARTRCSMMTSSW